MLERRTAVDTDVDLLSCYDLIGHAAASLSMKSQGAPAPPIVSMFTTLQNMELYWAIILPVEQASHISRSHCLGTEYAGIHCTP